MKKILFSGLLLGLITGSGVLAQNDGIFETVTIPSYSQIPTTQVKGIVTEQGQIKSQTKETKKDGVYSIPKAKVSNNIYEPIMNMLGKYKNQVKVIYSDIDGIIVPENYNGLTYRDKVYTSFSKLSQNNIPFIFTTGRTFKEAKKAANQLEINPKYFITQNGAEITDSDGNILYENTMNLYFRRKMNSEVNFFNYFYNQDLKIAFYQRGNVYTFTESNIPDLLDNPISIDRLSQIPKNAGISKIKVYGKESHTLDIFKRYIQRHYKFLTIETVSSNSIDISMKTATKADAVKILSEKLNIGLENSAAFGYAQNDVDLMNLIRENGGLAISTDNSYQEVKDASSYITKDLDSDGFAFAIDTIIGNNKILNSQYFYMEN